jgi:hypothetical protein
VIRWFPAFITAAVLAHPASAQDKTAAERAQKVLVDNDRVRATENVFKPGEANAVQERGYRITRVLKGNTTIERTYADGKTERVQWNEGGAEVVTYTVTLKQSK